MRIVMEPIPADGRGYWWLMALHHILHYRRYTTKECCVPSALWSQLTSLVTGGTALCSHESGEGSLGGSLPHLWRQAAREVRTQ